MHRGRSVAGRERRLRRSEDRIWPDFSSIVRALFREVRARFVRIWGRWRALLGSNLGGHSDNSTVLLRVALALERDFICHLGEQTTGALPLFDLRTGCQNSGALLRCQNSVFESSVAGDGVSSQNPGASFAKPESSSGHPARMFSLDDAPGIPAQVGDSYGHSAAGQAVAHQFEKAQTLGRQESS